MPIMVAGHDIGTRIALPDDPTMEDALLQAAVPPEAAAQFSNVKLPFTPRPNQITSLQGLLAWPRMGLFDEARCLPGETEFLTPTGWKRIDAYTEGDLVGQVDPETRAVTFVRPERYVVDYASELVMYESKKGFGTSLRFMATRDHKLLTYYTTYHRDGRISRRPITTYAADLLQAKSKLQKIGFANTFSVDKPGIALSDPEIRVMVAVMADGYFFNHRGWARREASQGYVSHGDQKRQEEETGKYSRHVELQVKKLRKAIRLEELLTDAGIQYNKSEYPLSGRIRYSFYAPRLEKEFTEYWWDCTTAQLQVVVDEAEFWDGSRSGKSRRNYMFSTGSQKSADFVQYAAAAIGRTASLGFQDRSHVEARVNQSVEYYVTIQDRGTDYGLLKRNICFADNPDPDNRVYCFTVPTGFFVTRFRGRIVLTGNCGKTLSLQLAATYLGHYGMKTVFLMPPVLFPQFTEAFSKISNHGRYLHVLDNPAASRKRILEEIANGHSPIDMLVMTKEVFKINLLDIMMAGFQVLYFDECHIGLSVPKTKTNTGQRTTYASVKYFVDNVAGSRLALSTGTPVCNEIIGTYPIISLKSPNAYASFEDFCGTHVSFKQLKIRTPKGDRHIMVPDTNGYMEVGLLTRNLHHQAVRARKLDVLDIQRPNLQEIPVTLHKGHYQLYRRVMQEKILEIGTKLIDARNASKLRAFAMQLITDPGIAYKPAPPNAVMEAVQVLFDTVDVKHNKVLLFANFNVSVEILAKTFEKLNPAVVYGPNGPTRNQAEVKKFRTNKDCRILVANPQAGGVGLTLGDVAQTVIFVEPVSTPGAFDQASSRVILSGQTEPVVIYFLRVNNTLSKRAIEVMLGRAQQAKEVQLDHQSMLDDLLGV